MALCSGGGGGRGDGVVQGGVDLAGHVTLEAADDFWFGLALLGAAGGVFLGGFVVAEADDDDAVEGGVGLAVPAAVEAVTDGFAGGGRDGRGPAEHGEGGFGVETFGVVAGSDEQGAGGVGP